MVLEKTCTDIFLSVLYCHQGDGLDLTGTAVLKEAVFPQQQRSSLYQK